MVCLYPRGVYAPLFFYIKFRQNFLSENLTLTDNYGNIWTVNKLCKQIEGGEYMDKKKPIKKHKVSTFLTDDGLEKLDFLCEEACLSRPEFLRQIIYKMAKELNVGEEA